MGAWDNPRLFSSRLLSAQTIPSLETFLMLSLKATTFEWLRKSSSESLDILCSNCSFTLADRPNMASGCCEVTCGKKHFTFVSKSGTLVVPIRQLNIRPVIRWLPGWSDLCCDLLHDVNKVVNVPVQFGTVQKHGLQLFDGRVHIFTCNTTTRQLTARRGNVQALILKKDSCKSIIRMQGRSYGLLTNETGAHEDKCYWCAVLQSNTAYNQSLYSSWGGDKKNRQKHREMYYFLIVVIST